MYRMGLHSRCCEGYSARSAQGIDARRAPRRNEARGDGQERQEQAPSRRTSPHRSDALRRVSPAITRVRASAPAVPIATPIAISTSARRSTDHITDDAARPERHAHADLVRLLADRVGQDAVDADRREARARRIANSADHRHAEALRLHRIGHDVDDRLRVGQRQLADRAAAARLRNRRASGTGGRGRTAHQEVDRGDRS